MSAFETYDRDDPPEVAAVTVFMRRDTDGLPVYTPRAADWVSLLPDGAAAEVCAHAAAACDMLAETFDPDVNKTAPAPVIRLADHQPEGDGDDDGRDGAA